MAKSDEQVIGEFEDLVNTKPKELENWLDSGAPHLIGRRDGESGSQDEDRKAEYTVPKERLYDPNEADNLSVKQAHDKVLRQMRGKLRAWMEETGDPLLDGPEPRSTTPIRPPRTPRRT